MGREYLSAVVSRNGDLTIVTDLDLAIYIYHRNRKDPGLGLKVTDVIRVGQGQHEIYFHDPNNIARRLELEYANGPEVEVLDAQRDLKRLMRDITSTARRNQPEVSYARSGQGRGQQRR